MAGVGRRSWAVLWRGCGANTSKDWERICGINIFLHYRTKLVDFTVRQIVISFVFCGNCVFTVSQSESRGTAAKTTACIHSLDGLRSLGIRKPLFKVPLASACTLDLFLSPRITESVQNPSPSMSKRPTVAAHLDWLAVDPRCLGRSFNER
jgi:hypothetical protein